MRLDLILVRLDLLDLGHDEVHALWDEVPPGPEEAGGVEHLEGDEQEAGLIEMVLVLVDEGDVPGLGGELLAELVRHDGACSACTEDEERLHRNRTHV